MASETPWKNGIYNTSAMSSLLIKVDGNKNTIYSVTYLDDPETANSYISGNWTSGDFGPAKEEVKNAAGGIENYNIEMDTFAGKAKGILIPDGTKVYSWSLLINDMEIIEFQTEADLQKLSDDREDFATMTVPCKIQPENQGKLIWLTGPPGAGKSTTGANLARDTPDYAYYEADCCFGFTNPFLDPKQDVNPSLASVKQPPIKNYSKDLMNALQDAKGIFEKVSKQQYDQIDWVQMHPVYACMAKDIDFQKKRIGGNLVVAHAIPTRKARDVVREVIPECIFITLTLTAETQRKRVLARHGEGEESEHMLNYLTTIFKVYEAAGGDEPNSFNLDITEDMTETDVKNAVLELVK